MLNLIMLIFVGGAFGAMCREFVMLSVPRLADGFPMDIFVANIVAAFLLGVATSLFKSNRINQYVHVMIGTGIMGGTENEITLVTSDGAEPWPRLAKAEVARRLAARIAEALQDAGVAAS